MTMFRAGFSQKPQNRFVKSILFSRRCSKRFLENVLNNKLSDELRWFPRTEKNTSEVFRLPKYIPNTIVIAGALLLFASTFSTAFAQAVRGSERTGTERANLDR